jgi:hypothetical protein
MFKDSLIEVCSFRRFPRELQHCKDICESLNTESYRAMAHIGSLRLWSRIEVDINHTIEILYRRSNDGMKLVEVELAIASAAESR